MQLQICGGFLRNLHNFDENPREVIQSDCQADDGTDEGNAQINACDGQYDAVF